ncbi:uncharacterized protein LOC144477565 [Augochlora pura]
MYGAPVWAPAILAGRHRRLGKLLRRLQRWIAIRLIREYRTTSTAVDLPFELEAAVRAYIYRIRVARRTRGSPLRPEIQEYELRARRPAWATWREELQSHAGQRVAGTLLLH